MPTTSCLLLVFVVVCTAGVPADAGAVCVMWFLFTNILDTDMRQYSNVTSTQSTLILFMRIKMPCVHDPGTNGSKVVGHSNTAFITAFHLSPQCVINPNYAKTIKNEIHPLDWTAPRNVMSCDDSCPWTQGITFDRHGSNALGLDWCSMVASGGDQQTQLEIIFVLWKGLELEEKVAIWLTDKLCNAKQISKPSQIKY